MLFALCLDFFFSIILGWQVISLSLLIRFVVICFFAEPSPLHTTTIVEKCTLKLVDEYKHMLCQATEPMSTFLEYITYVEFFYPSTNALSQNYYIYVDIFIFLKMFICYELYRYLKVWLGPKFYVAFSDMVT